MNALVAAASNPLTEWYRSLGNYRWTVWLLAGMVIVLLAAWMADQLWRRATARLSEKGANSLQKLLAEGARKPLLGLVLSGGAKLVFDATVHQAREAAEVAASAAQVAAGLPGHWTGSFMVTFVGGALYVAVVLTASAVGYALVVAVCDWYLLHAASKTKTTLNQAFIPTLRRLAKVAAVFVAVTVILQRFEVKITALLGIAGFASLAVALASKDTLANMISGFTILADRPFRVGDRVQLGKSITGDVREIGLRSTKILTFDNTLLILPNTKIASAKIVNQSYPDPKFKIRREFSVAYGSDVDKVKTILIEIAKADRKVLKKPKPRAFFTDFGESALVFRLMCWIENYKDRFGTIDRINVAVDRRFREEGIQIPFPQRDIHIRGGSAAPAAPPGQPGPERGAAEATGGD